MRCEVGFGVIKLPLGGGKLQVQIKGVEPAMFLCEGKRGFAGLARSQENHGRKLVKKLSQTLLG